ncbi:MAG: cyclic nucleotide-binding/CBS domain-containing protein [Gaiellales bacterium]|jgi:CBS domain-containing protein|nr:CBS domain-containing protein [Gaiellales bacterium]
MGVTLRNFMTTENVLTISGDATLTEAARQMCDRNVGAVVVVEAGSIAGIFTERDLLRAVAGGQRPDESPVAGSMTRDPVTLPPDHAPSEAAEIMSRGKFRHIPVVEQGRLLGIVSIRDLVTAGLQLASDDAHVGSDFP